MQAVLPSSPNAAEHLSPLPLLKDPAVYRPCHWDLKTNPDQRRYWLDLFRTHFKSMMEYVVEDAADRGISEAVVTEQIQQATQTFFDWLDQADTHPQDLERLDVLSICYEREAVLERLAIPDPYRLAKRTQNEQCLPLLPTLLKELDAMPESERDLAVIQGVFAGNIFDLGAPETIALFASGDIQFDEVRARLKPRPWLVDGLDAWLQDLQDKTHRCALLFVDNAGPDICLGMIPFARYLLQRGTRVILTANTYPSLNDVTLDELDDLLDQACDLDKTLGDAVAEGRLQLVASGNNAPLIDLSRLSPELIQVCQKEPIDLVVLEGMGRGIESNFHAEFVCDALNIAMLKDVGVATTLNGEPFDLVFHYKPTPQHA